jgi:hypothetical protein
METTTARFMLATLSPHPRPTLWRHLIPASVLLVIASYVCVGQQEARPKPGAAGIGTRSLSYDVDFEAESLGVAAGHLMSAFHIPGGVVIVEGCSAPPARSFRLQRGTTLNEALDVFVGEFGDRVTIGPGFLDIWSDAGAPPLLATRIKRLEWRRDARPDSVFGELMNSPELSVRAGELGLERAPGQGGAVVINMGAPHRETPDAEQPLRIEGATLLEALNSLAVSKGKVVWEYVEQVCGSRRTWTVNLTCPVTALWTDSRRRRLRGNEM